MGSESTYNVGKNASSREEFGYQRMKAACSALLFWDAVGRPYCAVR